MRGSGIEGELGHLLVWIGAGNAGHRIVGDRAPVNNNQIGFVFRCGPHVVMGVFDVYRSDASGNKLHGIRTRPITEEIRRIRKAHISRDSVEVV